VTHQCCARCFDSRAPKEGLTSDRSVAGPGRTKPNHSGNVNPLLGRFKQWHNRRMVSPPDTDQDPVELRRIEGIRRQADESLRRLGASAESQIAWLTDFGVGIADELALEFNHWAMVIISMSDTYHPSEQTIQGLRQLDQILEDISGSTGLWSFESLRSSDEWAAIRSLASQVLISWEADALDQPRT
jgi:hypothetical protein